MHLIATNLCDTPMVLKGGTALLLCYGLDRFSEDLDFDSSKKMRLESRIAKAVEGKFSIHEIKLLKDTGTVQRLRILYSDNVTKIKGSLKIETSFKDTVPHFPRKGQAGASLEEMQKAIEQGSESWSK